MRPSLFASAALRIYTQPNAKISIPLFDVIPQTRILGDGDIFQIKCRRFATEILLAFSLLVFRGHTVSEFVQVEWPSTTLKLGVVCLGSSAYDRGSLQVEACSWNFGAGICTLMMCFPL